MVGMVANETEEQDWEKWRAKYDSAQYRALLKFVDGSATNFKMSRPWCWFTILPPVRWRWYRRACVSCRRPGIFRRFLLFGWFRWRVLSFQRSTIHAMTQVLVVSHKVRVEICSWNFGFKARPKNSEIQLAKRSLSTRILPLSFPSVILSKPYKWSCRWKDLYLFCLKNTGTTVFMKASGLCTLNARPCGNQETTDSIPEFSTYSSILCSL